MSDQFKNAIKRNPFVRGMLRVVDAGCRTGVDVRRQPSHSKSNWDVLGEDWKKVGRDISVSIDRFRNEAAVTR